MSYSSETWIYLKSVQNMINVFERWCYRRMLRISWTEHVTNEEVFNRANTKPTLLDGLLKRRLAFHGHLVRKGGITLVEPAKSHGISVSLQKSTLTSRSHGNVKETHGILVIWGKYFFSAKKSSFSVGSCEMWVSECTLAVFCARGKNLGFLSGKNSATTPPHWFATCLESTENFCYYPPPHWIASASGDHGKDSRNSTSSTWQLCTRPDDWTPTWNQTQRKTTNHLAEGPRYTSKHQLQRGDNHTER